MAAGESAIFTAALNVCLSGIVGYGLYKVSTIRGESRKATDYGRKCLAWMVAIGTLSTMPKFFRHLNAESFATWIIIVFFFGVVGFVAGWVYGKFFGISQQTIQEFPAENSKMENRSIESGAGKTAGFAIVIIIAAVIGGAFGRESIHWLFNRKPEVKPQAFLTQVASELNKRLPMMIDKETELVMGSGMSIDNWYMWRFEGSSNGWNTALKFHDDLCHVIACDDHSSTLFHDAADDPRHRAGHLNQ